MRHSQAKNRQAILALIAAGTTGFLILAIQLIVTALPLMGHAL
jgi:hypothetical protein